MGVRAARGTGAWPGAAAVFTAAAAALVALVVIGCHAARYFFLFDDFALLREAATSSFTRFAEAPAIGFYRPAGFFLLKLELLAFGWQQPWGYATASALLHLANAGLVGGVSRRVGATPAGAFVAAVLFLLSPWSAETYFWASSLFDLTSALGVLAAVYCALSAADATGAKRRAAWLALGCASALIAVFSKESGVILPALLLVLAGFARPGALRRPWLASHLLAVLGSVGLYLWIRQGVLPGLEGAYGKASVLFARADVVGNAVSYLRAFITFPSHNVGLGRWPPPAFVAALGLGYAALCLSVVSRGWRLVTAGVLSFFISLAPVLWVPMLPGSSAVGRFLYVPAAWVSVLVGLAAFVERAPGAGGRQASVWRARAAHLSVVVLLAVAVASVVYQSRLWRSATQISRSAIRQFEPVLDRGLDAVYIPNLPFWFAEGPYVMRSTAFSDYYGEHHAVPVVTAREMVVSGHGGDLRFAGWLEESLRTTTAPPKGPVLELRLGIIGTPPPAGAPTGQGLH